MNKIIKSEVNGVVKVQVIFEDGSKCEPTIFTEKTKGKTHYHLPTPNVSNREYLSKDMVDKFLDSVGVFEFETRTREKRVLGDWRSRLEPEELDELKKCEERIDELKNLGLSRKPKDPKDAEIERLKKLIAEMEKANQKPINPNLKK